MRYDVGHITVYDWGTLVPFADCLLRPIPVDRRDQRVVAADLVIEPAPDRRVDEIDFFGNRTVRISFRLPHRRLTIRAASLVEVDPAPLFATDPTPPWEEIRDRAAATRGLAPTDPIHFLFPSRSIGLTPAVTAWAAADFPPGRPVLSAVTALTRRIRSEFTYAPGTTDVSTPLAVAFAERRGVCQDFTQVMIAALRGLGLPAAYIGGYLRTLPPPGRPRLEGADAMHAWVEVWCGPTVGWIGFDPTNGIVASSDHIVVAVGRDYADVSPVTGVLFAAGDAQALTVAVDVVERPEPAALDTAPAAAEIADRPAAPVG